MARAKSRVEKTESTARVERKEKMQEPLKLEKTDFNHIKLTDSQLKFFRTCSSNFLTVCTGPAGTAKTFIACYAALDHLRKDELGYKKIILARPAVESGENLGFLPGTIKEKIEPYMDGYVGNMEKIIKNHEKLKKLIEKGVIDMQPLAFMRSRTFDDTILILDEAQNADLRQIMLVVTRMGQNSKIIICGDITQWDIAKRKKDLLTFKDKISEGVNECSSFEFTREDIVRNPILIQLTDNYEKYKTDNNLE